MAFTVNGEYERLMKYKNKSKYGQLPFECGVACGYVTRIEYLPNRYDKEIHNWLDEELHIYAIAGWSITEELVLVLQEHDVSKRYQDRKYKYWKQYNVLESFVR